MDADDPSNADMENETSYSKVVSNHGSSTPRSPIQKVGHVLLSPARFVGRKFKPGGMKGSIFSLITAILGSGTITLPYLAYNNGIYVAAVLIIFGAVLSYF